MQIAPPDSDWKSITIIQFNKPSCNIPLPVIANQPGYLCYIGMQYNGCQPLRDLKGFISSN